MGKTKYIIYLSDEEKSKLKELLETAPEKTALRARILLESDFKNPDYCSNTILAEKLGTSHTTVQHVRADYATLGFEGAIFPRGKFSTDRRPVNTPEDRQRILSVIYSDPPYGYRWWSVRLIAEACVQKGYFAHLSPSAVYKIIKEENIDLRRPDRFQS